MTSYNIPEDVIGIPLFVPSNNNFFSIGTGEMPNGDNCLVIHGDTNSDYKAFQPAQTLSPNVFLSRVATYAMTFWIKIAATGGVASNPGQNTLFAVMTTNASETRFATTEVMWGVGTTPSGNITFNSTTTASPYSIVARDGTWHLVTLNNSAGTINVYLDLATTAGATGAGSGSPVTTGQYFCIGAYSDQGSMDGCDLEWRLGKLAFHDHVLNSTERALLYNEMI